MTTFTLAILILVSTIIYFVLAKLSRQPGKENASLIFVSRLLAVFILVLTVFYFYKRFAG